MWAVPFFPPSCFVVSFWGWSWMRKIVTCGKSQVLGRLPLFSSCPVDAGSIGTGLTLSPWIKRRLPQLCEKKSLVLHFDCGNFCWLNMEAKLQDEGGEKDQDIASVYILWTCTVWGRCLFVAFVISIINMENRWQKIMFWHTQLYWICSCALFTLWLISHRMAFFLSWDGMQFIFDDIQSTDVRWWLVLPLCV